MTKKLIRTVSYTGMLAANKVDIKKRVHLGPIVDEMLLDDEVSHNGELLGLTLAQLDETPDEYKEKFNGAGSLHFAQAETAGMWMHRYGEKLTGLNASKHKVWSQLAKKLGPKGANLLVRGKTNEATIALLTQSTDLEEAQSTEAPEDAG